MEGFSPQKARNSDKLRSMWVCSKRWLITGFDEGISDEVISINNNKKKGMRQR